MAVPAKRRWSHQFACRRDAYVSSGNDAKLPTLDNNKIWGQSWIVAIF